MAAGLNNVASSDNYSDTNTLTGQVTRRINFIISGNSIYYQILAADPKQGRNPVFGAWMPERFLPCSPSQTVFASLARNAAGVRFRSAVAGKPAQVTVEMPTDYELSSG